MDLFEMHLARYCAPTLLGAKAANLVSLDAQKVPALQGTVEAYNRQFAACGLCYGAGSLLWFYILKHFPFSMAYPMVSLSYVFGMIAAIVFFHEDVNLMKWIGVVLIMLGCFFIARS